MSFTATAFMTCYNEADIIGHTIRHLTEQGVQVYVIDNWSTDNSAEIAKSFPLAGYEKFPQEGPSKYYSWKPLLLRVEALIRECESDWVIHHDADEVRRSSVKGERMIEALERVNAQGYNAIDYAVYHFLPVDDSYDGAVSPEDYFKHYTTDGVDGRCCHVKAWRNQPTTFRLAETGGHWGPGRGVRIYPHKFVLKHYPVRNSVQAERKVVRERMNRYDPAERARGWHVQYDTWDTKNWIRNPSTLKVWSEKCR